MKKLEEGVDMPMDNNGPVCSICEQGDMGLFGDPLTEADQLKLKNEEEKKKETEADEK